MDISFLAETLLFQGADEHEVRTMLDCLDAASKKLPKGSVIYRAGEPARCMGMVLTGSVHIENDDIWGNKSILDHVGPGQVFAESYACVPGEPLMVSVIAAEDCEILFLDVSRVLQPCSKACAHHLRLIRSLLYLAAQKNLILSRRIFHTSSKSIRGRLLSYLSEQALRQGSNDFVVPFNRQQLADYLSVDRSALSHELSKMQRDGLLTVSKNHFCLKSRA